MRFGSGTETSDLLKDGYTDVFVSALVVEGLPDGVTSGAG